MACYNNKCAGKVAPSCPPARPQGFGTDLFYSGPNLSNGIKTLDDFNTVVRKLSEMNNCIAPTIVTQPESQTIGIGDTITLSIEYTGSNVDVQWYKDNVALSGETNNVLTITNAQDSNLGNYYATLTNNCGSATSTTAVISKTAPEMFYYGSNADGSTPSDPTDLQHSAAYTPGHDISADYSDVTDPAYLIMAVPSTEAVRTKWYISASNQGNIDSAPGGSNFFYQIVSGSTRYYISNYPSLSADPVVFKVS